MRLRTVLIGFAFALTVLSLHAQPLIPVGLASVDITPDKPMALTGYGGRPAPYESVQQHIYAKAMVIGGDSQKPAVIITTDLIGFPLEFSDQLSIRLEKSGIKRDQLAVTATHTHTGPETGVLINISGKPLTADELHAVMRYREQLLDKLEQLVKSALADRMPSRIYYGKGQANFAMNRRMIENGKWVGFGKNDGPTEHDLPVLHIRDAKGNTRGILLNYACHGTTLVPKHNYIHGDWMGDAQQILEQENPGAVAMVMIGCGADSDPQPRGEAEYTVQHGRTIATEVGRILKNPMTSIKSVPRTSLERWPLEYDSIPSAETLWRRSTRKDVSGMQARNYLETLTRGGRLETDHWYPIQVWTFGDDLTMVFLGGEVVVDYVHRMKRELGADKLWMNAYSNDVSCYIASARLYDEGGYEVDYSMAYYNKPSRFVRDTEEQIVQNILRQVKSLRSKK